MTDSRLLEQDILGAILKDNKLLNEALGQGVTSDMFLFEPHKEIWETAIKLHSNSMAIDVTTLVESYKGDINKLGGVSYITEIQINLVTLHSFNDHLKLLITRYQKNQVSLLVYAASKKIKSDPTEDVIQYLQQKILDILRITTKENKDRLTRYMERITEHYNVRFGNVKPSYASGFRHLDEKLGGFRKGNYITIVSGSAVGKTTLAINMAYNMAKSGIKTVFYSIEMTESELLDKLSSSVLSIDNRKVAASNLTDDEMQGVETFLNDLIHIPIDIVQEITSTEELLNNIRYRVLGDEVEVVFIDYLQLFCEGSKGNTLTEKLGDLTINLKKLAQKNNIVIIAMGQTNREANARMDSNKKESFELSEKDIQDSARIFQNSNIVLGIARNVFLDDPGKRKELGDNRMLDYHSYDLAKNPELMMVQILKNRGGSVGRVALRYVGRLSRVENFK